MKKALFISVLCIPLLTGCGFLNQFRILTPEQQIMIDPKVLQSCERLPVLEGRTDIAVAEHHIRTIEAYGVCAQKQETSIKTIRLLANIPE